MRKLLVTAAIALGAAACGSSPQPAPAASSSAPRVSAAAACRDFAAWWAATGNGARVTDNATLRRAVAEAPSGTLYADMNAVETVLKTAALPAGGVAALARQVVNGDCAAVNPAS